ncbi:hypothetical protein DRN58_09970 [Thermococci archaeon]|nr:MAG: hypothetical protein DRN58_09970 [Thermococci archaeon]
MNEKEKYDEFIKLIFKETLGSFKDRVKIVIKNLPVIAPIFGSYFNATMNELTHEIQLRGLYRIFHLEEKIKDETDDIKKAFQEIIEIVRKYEEKTYPFKIYTKNDLEEIGKHLRFNPQFIKGYIERKNLKDLEIRRNTLIVGKIGAGKTTTIMRLLKKCEFETIIVVLPTVRSLGVSHFADLKLKGKNLLVWDDIQENTEKFLDALPLLRDKNLLVLGGIRSTDYENLKKDVAFRERGEFLPIDIELFSKEEIKKMILLCEKEFNKSLNEDLREKLINKVFITDSTPLYIVSVFSSSGKITEKSIETLPDNVIELWKGYFNDLSSNERSFMKAMKTVSLGATLPYKKLVKDLYEKAFSGEKRELSHVIEALKKKYWIRDIVDYYFAYDAQLECFDLSETDWEMLLDHLFKSKIEGDEYVVLLNGIGFFFYNNGRYDITIRCQDKILEIEPEDPEAYYNRGNAYSRKEEFDKAINDYNKAIELRPEFSEAYYNRGNAYSRKEEFDKAINDYITCAVQFLKSGVIERSIIHFIQIFNVYKTKDDLIEKGVKCGVIGAWILKFVKFKVYIKEKEFRDLLNDLWEKKELIKDPQILFMLYYLYNKIDPTVSPEDLLKEARGEEKDVIIFIINSIKKKELSKELVLIAEKSQDELDVIAWVLLLGYIDSLRQ